MFVDSKVSKKTLNKALYQISFKSVTHIKAFWVYSLVSVRVQSDVIKVRAYTKPLDARGNVHNQTGTI